MDNNKIQEDIKELYDIINMVSQDIRRTPKRWRWLPFAGRWNFFCLPERGGDVDEVGAWRGADDNQPDFRSVELHQQHI